MLEALRSGRELNRIMVARGAGGSVDEILHLARKAGVPVQRVERARLDALARSRAHQGVLAWGSPRAYVEVEDILRRARARSEPPLVLVLDGIQDPRNFGALLRTAEATGVHGAIIPKRRAAPLTPAAGKASAGAVEHLPVARVPNLARVLEELKEEGLWVVGAEAGGRVPWEVDLAGPLALVIGGEGRGMGRLVREKCDILVGLPMLGHVSSLNAGAAAAAILYEAIRQKRRGPAGPVPPAGRLDG